MGRKLFAVTSSFPLRSSRCVFFLYVSGHHAKAFKRWVTHEVIPSIRKTGAYATNNALTMPNFSNPAEAARAWADEYSYNS